MKTTTLAFVAAALSTLSLAQAARADHFSVTQEGTSTRIMNDDEEVSIAVPPGFKAMQATKETSIWLEAPTEARILVGRAIIDRQSFRESCRGAQRFLEKSQRTDTCLATGSNGRRGAQLWVAPGFFVTTASATGTFDDLSLVAKAVAASLRYRIGFDVPDGFVVERNGDDTYFTNHDGLAFMIEADNTGEVLGGGVEKIMRSGSFGHFRSFKTIDGERDQVVTTVRAEIIQDDGSKAVGVLSHVNAARPAWVMTMAAPGEWKAAGQLNERIVRSILAK